MGLEVTENETRYMEASANPSRIQYLEVGEYIFEKVAEFK
jgi:hypothetical protein